MKSPEYVEKLLKHPTKAFIESNSKQITSPKAIRRFEQKSSRLLGGGFPRDVIKTSNELAIEMNNNIAKSNNGNFKRIMRDKMN